MTRGGYGGIELYRLDATRRARLVQQIAAPDGMHPNFDDLSLSGGPSPSVCAVWSSDESDTDGPEQVWCYERDSAGRRLPVEGEPSEVVLRADGRAVLWQSHVDTGSYETSYYQLVVAHYDRGRVSDQRVFATQAQQLPGGTEALDGDCGEDTVSTALFVGDDRLLIQGWGANDFPGQISVHPLNASAGCRDVEEPDHQDDEGYNNYRVTTLADRSSFLALEGEWCEIECPDHLPQEPDRAVRVDLATGRVLEVVATPAQGRYVESVTGGQHGIVYVTDAPGQRRDRRIYLRWPGEKHGKPVIGLPADVEEIVAQP